MYHLDHQVEKIIPYSFTEKPRTLAGVRQYCKNQLEKNKANAFAFDDDDDSAQMPGLPEALAVAGLDMDTPQSSQSSDKPPFVLCGAKKVGFAKNVHVLSQSSNAPPFVLNEHKAGFHKKKEGLKRVIIDDSGKIIFVLNIFKFLGCVYVLILKIF